jgi:hypothetical protein
MDGSENEIRPGSVRVFEYSNDGVWSQRGPNLIGEADGDVFGNSASVAIIANKGNTLTVGANRNDGKAGVDSGHVRVFDWSGGDWIQRGSDIEGQQSGEQFGTAVALSDEGNHIVIGAEQNRRNGLEAGAFRVYFWDGNEWIQQGSSFDGKMAGDRTGAAVTMSRDGSVFAFGAYLNDENRADAGEVRAYEILY